MRPAPTLFPSFFQSAEASRRCETGAVSINVKRSAVKRSPSARVALCMLPVILLIALPRGKSFRRLSVGFVERARRKLPYALGTVRRRCNGVVSEKRRHMSIECSPLNRAVIILPGVLPAALAQEDAPCCLCPRKRMSASAPALALFPLSSSRLCASECLLAFESWVWSEPVLTIRFGLYTWPLVHGSGKEKRVTRRFDVPQPIPSLPAVFVQFPSAAD